MFRKKPRSHSANEVAAQQKQRNKGQKGIMLKTKSAPVVRRNRRLRSVMRFVSEDDSLHSVYGSERGNDEKPKKNLNVKWAHIDLREYARTVGDNPSCSSGPPVSISWEHGETKRLTVDVYEETRPPRRTNIEMILPRDLRQRMLKKEWDVTQSQIAAAVRTNIKIKNQRRTTVNNLGKSTKLEEAMENAGKGLSGVFGRNTEKKVKKLEAKMEAAEKARKQMMMEEMMETDDDKTHPEGTGTTVPTEDTMDVDPDSE